MSSRHAERPLLEAGTAQEWREWLEGHYRTAREVWLVFHKKHTGKERITYNDAVEQALCFGWIDSTVVTLDEDRFAQRFSARNPRSSYSQANKERLRGLAAEGRIAVDVLPAIQGVLEESFEVPADILAAVKADPDAWRHYQELSEPYIRIRIAYIEGARKRPEEFDKRLRYFITMTAKNKRFGFGGIEKYY